MLQMRLKALEHPTADDVNVHDRKVFASTVLWLEDQKIRQYKIEDRENLRKVDNTIVWDEAFVQYKNDLGMPSFGTPLEEITWLLGYAIRLEFLDDPDKYKGISAQKISQQQKKSIQPSVRAKNVFDNMDFNHKDFIAGVRALGIKLKVAPHPNHLIQLEAVARIVHDRLAGPEAKSRQAVTGTPFPFEGNDVVSPNDQALDYPIRILRLLQIHSLRELQTHINETIVCVQNLTADPKTDTKLGKVGR